MVVIFLKGPKMPFFGNLQKHVLKQYYRNILPNIQVFILQDCPIVLNTRL